EQGLADRVKDQSARMAELSGVWSLSADARCGRCRAVASVNPRDSMVGRIAEIDAAIRADGDSRNSMRISGGGQTQWRGALQPGHSGECERAFEFIQLQ